MPADQDLFKVPKIVELATGLAPSICNVPRCNGKLVPQAIFAAMLDWTGQVVTATLGLGHGPR